MPDRIRWLPEMPASYPVLLIIEDTPRTLNTTCHFTARSEQQRNYCTFTGKQPPAEISDPI
jgi:hypothetical protein